MKQPSSCLFMLFPLSMQGWKWQRWTNLTSSFPSPSFSSLIAWFGVLHGIFSSFLFQDGPRTSMHCFVAAISIAYKAYMSPGPFPYFQCAAFQNGRVLTRCRLTERECFDEPRFGLFWYFPKVGFQSRVLQTRWWKILASTRDVFNIIWHNFNLLAFNFELSTSFNVGFLWDVLIYI